MPITIRSLPRPTVSLAKPAPRRDRKRPFDPAELLDPDFDNLGGELAPTQLR
jgi:hypothetical protein